MRNQAPPTALKFRSARVDRSVFSIGTLDQQTPEYVAAWRNRPVAERVAAVQFMRNVIYGQDAATGRLQRLLQVSQ